MAYNSKPMKKNITQCARLSNLSAPRGNENEFARVAIVVVVAAAVLHDFELS